MDAEIEISYLFSDLQHLQDNLGVVSW